MLKRVLLSPIYSSSLFEQYISYIIIINDYKFFLFTYTFKHVHDSFTFEDKILNKDNYKININTDLSHFFFSLVGTSISLSYHK